MRRVICPVPEAARAKDLYAAQFLCPQIELVKAFSPLLEQGRAFLRKKFHTAVDRDHKRIRRRTGLEDPQLPLDLLFTQQNSPEMEKGCLRQGRQRLMDALHHGISSERDRALRKTALFEQPEMRSVGFVDDKRHPGTMAQFRNLSDIGYHALIGRRREDNRGAVRISPDHTADLIRRDGTVDTKFPVPGRNDPVDFVSPQLDRVIDRPVAVPGGDDLAPERSCGPDRREQPAGAPPDQEPCPPAAPQGTCPLHSCQQYTVRVVKVIRPFDLRNVPIIGKAIGWPPSSLLPGHMHRKHLRCDPLDLPLKRSLKAHSSS